VTPSATKLEVRTAIRATGLRATHQRVAVLGVLSESSAPMSQAEISARLAHARDRSTIYRNLISLTRVGLVHRVDVGDRVWRFELHGPRHPHFVCERCSAVTCLTALELAADRVRAPRALKRGQFEVYLRGVCDKCHQVARGTRTQ
jgi:Fur family transcriptional regulator, ferric uptake regulator